MDDDMTWTMTFVPDVEACLSANAYRPTNLDCNTHCLASRLIGNRGLEMACGPERPQPNGDQSRCVACPTPAGYIRYMGRPHSDGLTSAAPWTSSLR